MTPIRIGIIGLGNIGQHHAAYLAAGQVPNASLAAVCTINEAKLAACHQKFPDVATFSTRADLLDSKTCDAVIIAGPHFSHVPIALDAFAKNLHVLVEKPLAVSISSAKHLVDSWNAKYRHLKFGIMFNQRTNPLYQKIKSLIADGELGHLSRISWTITNWFRPHAYYKSGGWRATWKGEGGGVLINQCPHNLDLLHWTTNLLPSRITAVGFAGKHHPIEVDDEISAILEYPASPTTQDSETRPLGSVGGGGIVNGGGGVPPIGHFNTTTGEFPGTNRLEIAGSRGKLTAENNKLTFARSRTDVTEFSKTSPNPFGAPELWTIDIPLLPPPQNEHAALTENFVNSITNNLPNDKLLAPGPDGLHSLEIGNAMLLAALTRTPTTLPLNPQSFDTFLESMAKSHPILPHPSTHTIPTA